MNTALIILTIVLVCIAIVLCVYLIITFRKIHIVAKKVDYLVEDLTYKTEQLTPLIDSVVKISNFIDIFDSVLKERSQKVIKYASGNEESIYKVAREIKDVVKRYRNGKVKAK